MNAADILWKLVMEGIVQPGSVPRACEVLHVSKTQLREARGRFECRVAPVPAGMTATSDRPSTIDRPEAARQDIAHPFGFNAKSGGAAPKVAERPREDSPAPAPAGPTTIIRNNPKITYTEAGRKRAIDKAFISLRVAQFSCDICGQPVQSGDVVVIDRAHHACCSGAKGRVA